MAKILIVDDDSAVQLTIRLLLERAGHRVVTAGDGRKGLAQFQAGDFDLLFVDIFMPGMDGFETMRMVHQQKPQTPIIVISGQPMSSEVGPRLPDHGHEAWRGLLPAKTVQAGRFAGRSCQLP